uniref:Protein-tyrosine-phosphatase n=1 Tax=Trichobilharzia regenti TaxID=157069 RepID=A0AA85IZ43_TRIRE|nr:unnamed protein product [Trichobilharzia regenti]
MRGVLIFMSFLTVISPSVKFVHEPEDACIPWHSQIQLNCEVNHPTAVYSWLAIHHAPLDLIFSNGYLEFLKEPNILFEKAETLVENSSFVNVNPFGGLLLRHPISVDKVSRSKALQPNYKSWLEGSYRCKASIPGQGSLVSRTANIRLSDLFLEPNLPTTHNLLPNSRQSLITEFQQHSSQHTTHLSSKIPTDTNKHPGLGGGSFFPGEVVVLRCPVITVSSVEPIIRWFHVTSDVMVMQPVGSDIHDPQGHSSWPNNYKAITLDSGRWLEIHLGYLNATTHTITGTSNHSDDNNQGGRSKRTDSDYRYPHVNKGTKQHPNENYFRAGFGEYFCEVQIPPSVQSDNDEEVINSSESEKIGLNDTGPYIPVTMFPTSSTTKATTLTPMSDSKLQHSISKDTVFWSAQPYDLVQIEFPSTFLHSLNVISTNSKVEVTNEAFALHHRHPSPPSPPPPTQQQQLLQQPKLSRDSQNIELWREVNSTVTLPCAGNIRQFIGGRVQKHLTSFGMLHTDSSHGLMNYHGYIIQWRKDGELLSDKMLSKVSYSPFHLVGSGSLMINNLQLNDTGLYSCQVVNAQKNEILLDETSIQLIVGQAPILLNASPIDIQARLHFEQVLWCHFITHYPTLIQWRKNSEIIQDSEYFRINNNYTHINQPGQQLPFTTTTATSQIRIQRILPNDAGYFQCLAENRFGSVQHSIHLQVVQSNSVDYINDGIDTNNFLMMIPTNVRVLNVSDTRADVIWDEPQWPLSKPLVYFIQIESSASPGHLIVNTTNLFIRLVELQPETVYTLKIFPTSIEKSGLKSDNFASVTFMTKPLIHRPPAVRDITAESRKYGTLTISWKAPSFITNVNDSNGSIETIVSYQIILRYRTSEPIGASDVTSRKPIEINVPVNKLTMHTDNRLSYTVLNLTPDAFYQITIYAITNKNITGRSAYLPSSSRVASRPPSKSPMNIHVHSVGAHVATISWQPPPVKYRNGQLIVYRINISCDDWLRPRYIMVRNKLSQLIKGLTSGTKYDLTISAATRAGNGPDSDVITFTTFTQKNEADSDGENSVDGEVLSGDAISEGLSAPMTHLPSLSDNRNLVSSLGPVENLQALADEQSLLVFWLPPHVVASSSSLHQTTSTGVVDSSFNGNLDIPSKYKPIRTDISHYIISWGKLHPGPDSVSLPRNQTSYSIENLEYDTTYYVKVVVVGVNQETKEALTTARTKPAASNERLLIPLNLHVSSSNSNWATLTWDKPECVQKPSNTGSLSHEQESNPSSFSSDCTFSSNLIKFYQVAYQMIGYASNRTNTKMKSGDQSSSSSSLSNQPDSELDKTQHLINVTQNWARLENLQFGRLYSVVVRAVGEKKSFKDSNFNMNHRNDESRLLFSEWSLEQIFETPEKKPGDSPRDISLIGLNAEPGEQPVSIQISWQPPFHPNGPLTGYFLYYTANHSLPLSEWSKRRLPPDSLNTVISGLLRNAVYAFRLTATNPFGDGPASSVNLYRTPDVYGQGGGVLTFTDHEYIKSGSSLSSVSLLHPYHSNPADIIYVKSASEKYPTGVTSITSSSSSSSGINTGKLLSAGRGANSLLIIGVMVGFLVLLLIILVVSVFWRKHRRNLNRFIGYKPGQNIDCLPEGDGMNVNDNTTTNNNNNISNNNNKTSRRQLFNKRRKCHNKSFSANQDVALLMSNGEAILASDIQQQQQQPLSSSLPGGVVMTGQPTMLLTTSMNLSAATGGVSSGGGPCGGEIVGGPLSPIVVTQNQGILHNNQNNMNSGSYSWDHDSDSLQFASVSQERTGDSRQSPGISGQQQTPTNAGSSGSTNSARGSIGTPTRLIQSSNLAYHQTHNYPNDAALGYAYPVTSIVPSNLINPTMLVGQRPAVLSPGVPISGYQNHLVVSSALPITGGNHTTTTNNIPNNYMVQYYPMTSVYNQVSRMPVDRLPSPHIVIPPQMVYTGQSSARYPNAIPCNIDPSQMATYAHVMNPSYATQPAFVNVNTTPRVNAAEIMSFTSSEDIGPVMSNSTNENDSQKFLYMNGGGSGGGGDSDHNRSKLYNPMHTTPKSKRTTGSSTGNTGSRSIASPRRRPLPNSNRNERNLDAHTNRLNVANQQSVMKDDSIHRGGGDGHTNTGKHANQDFKRNSVIVNNNNNGECGTENEGVQKAFSSEELSQEMANLEGLMKDLSAIAQEEFNC